MTCARFTLTRPLCLAAVSGAIKVMDVLIKHGADLYCRDTYDSNILHAITSMAAYFSDQEGRMVAVYHHLKATLDTEQLRSLLHMENDYSFRPLETACQQGRFRLMMAFFETPGVYVTKEISQNAIRYVYYDVTEYEDITKLEQWRQHTSPIRQLVNIGEDCLKDPFTISLFQPGSIIHTWAQSKYNINKPLLRVWFYVRMSYFMSYLFYDTDEHWMKNLNGIPSDMAEDVNVTHNASFVYCADFTSVRLSPTTITALTYYFIIYWIGATLFDLKDIYEIFRSLKQIFKYVAHSHAAMKQPVHKNFYYKLCNVITVNLIMAIMVMQYYDKRSTTTDVLRIIATCCGIWTPLFFVQVVPGVGHFVVIVQRIIGDIFNFSIVFIVILLPFSQMLLVYVNANSKQGCVEEFRSLGNSVYSVIKVMQNMLDLSEIQVENNVTLKAIQVALIFFVSILLLNFLIAIMSSSVANLVKHQSIIENIIYLHICYVLELRFNFLCSRYYNYMRKKHYVCEDGRIYLVKAEPVVNTEHAKDDNHE